MAVAARPAAANQGQLGGHPSLFSPTDYGHNFTVLAELLEGVTKKAKLLASENKKLRIALARRAQNRAPGETDDVDISVQGAAVQHIKELEGYVAELARRNELLERKCSDFEVQLDTKSVEKKVLESEKRELVKNLEELRQGAQDIIRDNNELVKINRDLNEQLAALTERNTQMEGKTLKSLERLMETHRDQAKTEETAGAREPADDRHTLMGANGSQFSGGVQRLQIIEQQPGAEARRNPREGELKALESRLAIMSDKYAVLVRAKAGLEEQLGEMALRLSTTEATLIRTNVALAKVKSENEQLSGDVTVSGRVLMATRGLLEEEQKSSAKLRQEIQEMSRTWKLNDEEIRSLAERSSTVVRNSCERFSAARRLEDENAGLRRQLAEYTDPVTGKLQQLSSDITMHLRNISTLQEERKQLVQDKTQLATKNERYKQELEALDERCNTLKRANKEAKAVSSELRAENERLGTEQARTKGELVQVTRRLKEVETIREAEQQNAKLQLQKVFETSDAERRNTNDALARTLTELDSLRSLYTNEMDKRRLEITKLRQQCTKEKKRRSEFKEALAAVTARCRQLEDILAQR